MLPPPRVLTPPLKSEAIPLTSEPPATLRRPPDPLTEIVVPKLALNEEAIAATHDEVAAFGAFTAGSLGGDAALADASRGVCNGLDDDGVVASAAPLAGGNLAAALPFATAPPPFFLPDGGAEIALLF